MLHCGIKNVATERFSRANVEAHSKGVTKFLKAVESMALRAKDRMLIRLRLKARYS